MFGPPGIAYVYRVYGMHDCLNVVSGPDGTASAVLVRAVEPLEGEVIMRAARAARERGDGARIARVPAPRLAAGPGLVGAAFSVDRAEDGLDLCDPGAPLHLDRGSRSPARLVVASPRVGIAYAGEPWVSLPWRLALADSPAVSRPRPVDG